MPAIDTVLPPFCVFQCETESVERLRQPCHSPFVAKPWFRSAGVLVCVLATLAVAKTCLAAGRTPYFSSGFGNYYVGVLYRNGKYLDAAALAKTLLDGDWISKETACAGGINQAYLVVQIYRRLGRDEAAVALLGVKVRALRNWVRGPDLERVPAEAATAAVRQETESKTRVMGWQKTNLGPTVPVPLEATPATVISARIAAPVLREAIVNYTVQSAKTFTPPAPPASSPPVGKRAKVDPEPAPKPIIRKIRPPAQTATASDSKPVAPAQRMEEWMERAFINN